MGEGMWKRENIREPGVGLRSCMCQKDVPGQVTLLPQAGRMCY